MVVAFSNGRQAWRAPEIRTDDQPACVMDVVAQDGTKLTIGLTYGALSTLIDALITNSPGTPGTPGRN